eukprot:c20716_g4_i2.p2 GENE.c20716_g4_i2~~c20716_g4_i2.p2  ORF type:complete len:110 (+),score=9.59 c20716_g4_i2:259-588(+)
MDIFVFCLFVFLLLFEVFVFLHGSSSLGFLRLFLLLPVLRSSFVFRCVEFYSRVWVRRMRSTLLITCFASSSNDRLKLIQWSQVQGQRTLVDMLLVGWERSESKLMRST